MMDFQVIKNLPKLNLNIRNALPSDIEEIYRVHQSSILEICSKSYSDEIVQEWVRNRSPQGYLPAIGRGEMFVATNLQKIVGFGHSVSGEIKAIFTDPNHANQGIGKILMEEALIRAKANCKEVLLEATLNAEKFYSKYGFIKTGESMARIGSVDIPVIRMRLHLE
jgi:putative acetyltransferase